MKFEKKELIEIEKVMDIQVGANLRLLADILNGLPNKTKESQQVKQLIQDFYESYNLFREISAKAQRIRKDQAKK